MLLTFDRLPEQEGVSVVEHEASEAPGEPRLCIAWKETFCYLTKDLLGYVPVYVKEEGTTVS